MTTKSKYVPIVDSEPYAMGGKQLIYRFENNYGASVVKNSFSYGGTQGKWELAVIKFDGEDFELVYDTPITSDVIGYLSWDNVEEYLDQIAAL